jgi:DNA-binding LacI/PurR family transcriptional regulator
MNIREVARRARVSTATVSRTLNGDQRVNSRTAAKVWRVIKEMKYYPNVHARTLGTGKSRTVGLLISDVTNPFFPDLVKGFEDAALLHGYGIMLGNTEFDAKRMALCAKHFIESRVEGIAIMTSEVNGELVGELVDRKLPLVFLDWGELRGRSSNIRVDYNEGISQAVHHLVALGHTRIGFISGPLNLISAQSRRKAFIESLTIAGISPDESLIVETHHKVEGGQIAMTKLLARQNHPTAVMCFNDLSAIGALQAIHRAGLRVPGDISLMGFDDIQLAEFVQPALTTVRLSRVDISRMAFDALMRMIQNEDITGQELVVGTKIVVRESTARAPARTAGSMHV